MLFLVLKLKPVWEQNYILNRKYHKIQHLLVLLIHSGRNRAKIPKVTLDAFKARQSLVKGERLVRHEMKAVLKIGI